MKPSTFLPFLVCASLIGCASSHPSHGEYQKIVLHPPKSAKDGPQQPLDDLIPGVENFGLISTDVWRGAEPTPEGLQILADLGVKTIIDLRQSDESALIPPGVRYVRLPVSAWHADQVNVKAVLDAIANNPKPVFIHCREGRDRTGLAIAAYRLSQHMSAKDACRELRNFHVNPWWTAAMENRIYAMSRQGITAPPLAEAAAPSAGQ